MKQNNTWIAANGDGFISQTNSGPLSQPKPLPMPCGLSCADGLQHAHAFHQNPNADQARTKDFVLKTTENYRRLFVVNSTSLSAKAQQDS